MPAFSITEFVVPHSWFILLSYFAYLDILLLQIVHSLQLKTYFFSLVQSLSLPVRCFSTLKRLFHSSYRSLFRLWSSQYILRFTRWQNRPISWHPNIFLLCLCTFLRSLVFTISCVLVVKVCRIQTLRQHIQKILFIVERTIFHWSSIIVTISQATIFQYRL